VALLCVYVTHKREREQVYSTQAILKAKMSADDHEQTARRVRGKDSQKFICLHTRATCSHKRAIYSHKRATYSHKRAIYTHKSPACHQKSHEMCNVEISADELAQTARRVRAKES